jgi:LPXTG-motif cell wall-anchored protein
MLKLDNFTTGGDVKQDEKQWTYIIAGLVGVSLLLLVSLVVVIIKKKR